MRSFASHLARLKNATRAFFDRLLGHEPIRRRQRIDRDLAGVLQIAQCAGDHVPRLLDDSRRDIAQVGDRIAQPLGEGCRQEIENLSPRIAAELSDATAKGGVSTLANRIWA